VESKTSCGKSWNLKLDNSCANYTWKMLLVYCFLSLYVDECLAVVLAVVT